MLMKFTRPVAAALIGALAITSLNLTPVQAASAKRHDQVQAANTAAATTDLSARRYSRGNAAVLGAVVGLFGTIAAIAAADRYRNGYYDGGPYYGRGYGAPYAYAPAYPSRTWRWNRHHH
ncbi:MAG: hypothetical protein WCI56_07280 [Hyphomicrobiales bacterium]